MTNDMSIDVIRKVINNIADRKVMTHLIENV